MSDPVVDTVASAERYNSAVQCVSDVVQHVSSMLRFTAVLRLQRFSDVLRVSAVRLISSVARRGWRVSSVVRRVSSVVRRFTVVSAVLRISAMLRSTAVLRLRLFSDVLRVSALLRLRRFSAGLRVSTVLFSADDQDPGRRPSRMHQFHPHLGNRHRCSRLPTCFYRSLRKRNRRHPLVARR
jgi:hypothetical protein